MKSWAPKCMHDRLPSSRFGKKGQSSGDACLHIEALGLKVRSKILHFQPSNCTEENMASMKQLGIKFLGTGGTFSMHNVLSMDLETCTVANTESRFMVYSIGWYHHSIGYHNLVAKTEIEFYTGSIVWEAFMKWK